MILFELGLLHYLWEGKAQVETGQRPRGSSEFVGTCTQGMNVVCAQQPGQRSKTKPVPPPPAWMPLSELVLCAPHATWEEPSRYLALSPGPSGSVVASGHP